MQLEERMKFKQKVFIYCDPDRGYDPGLGGSADVEGKRGNI